MTVEISSQFADEKFLCIWCTGTPCQQQCNLMWQMKALFAGSASLGEGGVERVWAAFLVLGLWIASWCVRLWGWVFLDSSLPKQWLRIQDLIQQWFFVKWKKNMVGFFFPPQLFLMRQSAKVCCRQTVWKCREMPWKCVDTHRKESYRIS